jgi:hypothetical protein
MRRSPTWRLVSLKVPEASTALQLAGRIIADAGHEADLMIDEDERRIFGSEGLVRVDLIVHRILLYVFG